MSQNPKRGDDTGRGKADPEILKLQFDYAWKYFEFHAKQRTTMYNFFLVFSAIIMNAQIRLFNNDDVWSAFVIGTMALLGVVMTVAFIFLDRRNEELVHYAETVLKDLEKDYLFKGYTREHAFKYRTLWGNFKKQVLIGDSGILTEQEIRDKEGCIKPSGRWNYSHAKWLPITQKIIFFSFIIIAIIPWGKLLFIGD